MIDRVKSFWQSQSWTRVLIGFVLVLSLIIAGVVFREQLSVWLTDFWDGLTLNKVLVFLGLFLGSLAISFAALGLVMVKIPARYFAADHQRDFMPDSPFLVRWGAVIAKNIAGVLLIILGILLSLPGVPGQGVLTILLGLIFLDIPGKRPLEARIIKRPSVLSAINKLRAKYDKPPLELD